MDSDWFVIFKVVLFRINPSFDGLSLDHLAVFNLFCLLGHLIRFLIDYSGMKKAPKLHKLIIVVDTLQTTFKRTILKLDLCYQKPVMKTRLAWTTLLKILETPKIQFNQQKTGFIYLTDKTWLRSCIRTLLEYFILVQFYHCLQPLYCSRSVIRVGGRGGGAATVQRKTITFWKLKDWLIKIMLKDWMKVYVLGNKT